MLNLRGKYYKPDDHQATITDEVDALRHLHVRRGPRVSYGVSPTKKDFPIQLRSLRVPTRIEEVSHDTDGQPHDWRWDERSGTVSILPGSYDDNVFSLTP